MTITLPRLKIISPGGVFSAAGVNAAINRQKAHIEDMVNGARGFDALLWNTSTATLATDTLSLTSKPRVLVIDTEGAGATDNLSTISNGTAYQQLWLKAANAGRVITVKHNVGNIKLWGAADVTLTSTNWLQLFYDGTQWSDSAPITQPPSSAFVINTARTVLGSNTASVTISSIPATYKHLMLVIEARTDSASIFETIFLRFNADATATNYYTQVMLINGTIITSSEQLGSQPGFYLTNMPCTGSSSPGNGHIVVFISNYASTTMRRNITFQTLAHISDLSGNTRFAYGGGDWINTAAAISSITFLPQSGTNILANSAYTLYGLN